MDHIKLQIQHLRMLTATKLKLLCGHPPVVTGCGSVTQSLLINSQKVLTPMCLVVFFSFFGFFTQIYPTHVKLLPTHISLCVLLMAAGSRVHAIGHVLGQRWLRDEQTSWESLLFIGLLF